MSAVWLEQQFSDFGPTTPLSFCVLYGYLLCYTLKVLKVIINLRIKTRGSWMVQLVEHPALDFEVVSSNPILGKEFT